MTAPAGQGGRIAALNTASVRSPSASCKCAAAAERAPDAARRVNGQGDCLAIVSVVPSSRFATADRDRHGDVATRATRSGYLDAEARR
jgi:hypothetical protein